MSSASWVAGKCFGLFVLVAPSAALLAIPTLIFSGFSWLVIGAAAAAALVSVFFAWLGLAVGIWVVDHVRGLIAAVSVWCLLLFGLDLALLTTGGSPWIHANRGLWVGALMASPLDTYRITLLFVLERAAFSGADLHRLTEWWLQHPINWFVGCLSAWCSLALACAIAGTNRRRSQ